MNKNAIETFSLSKDYGQKKAVEDLDLVVKKGTFFGLLGKNGAGKSTTIGMLTAALHPSKGKIRILDRPLDPDDPWFKARMGIVTEEPSLFSRLSALEQLVFAGRMFGLPPKEAERRSKILLQTLFLEKDSKTLICDFSRGMKKKLAIGCALIHSPRILFLDEPFEGVDAASSAVIRLVLQNLAKGSATILLTTHILEVAEKLCNHVAILHKGKLAYVNSVNAMHEKGETLEDAFHRVSSSNEPAPKIPDWLTSGENDE